MKCFAVGQLMRMLRRMAEEMALKKQWQLGGQSSQMCERTIWRRCIQEGPERMIVRFRTNRTLMSPRAVYRLLWACQ
ncbi:hypothetical protein TNCV_2980161 [Trichonephila clavipes]|nr:hypothetical protein TNCV_2980161 [Trichonephila clavipes]